MSLRVSRTPVLAAVTLTLLVVLLPARSASAAGDDLDSLRNNVGIAQDPTSNANFDGVGFSYSALALRAAGVAPGDTIEHADVSFTWPQTASGASDNVVARGQTINLVGAGGATKLAFLGASDHGPITAPFTFTYQYVDELGAVASESVEVPVTFSDWTLNAGTSVPAANNTSVIETSFRVSNSTQPEQVATHVFAVTVPLDGSKTLTSIRLPLGYPGQIHLFDLAVNVPSEPEPPAPGPLSAVDNYVVAPPGAQSAGFATREVVVPQGSGLLLFNADNAQQHDVVSTDASGLPTDLFSSPYTNPGATSTVEGVRTLPPGTYPFACSLHGTNMTGTLRVL